MLGHFFFGKEKKLFLNFVIPQSPYLKHNWLYFIGMIFKLVFVDVEEWKYSKFTRNVLIFWVDYIKLFDKKHNNFTQIRRFCNVLKYSAGDQKLDESCEIHLQCSGTKNAGFCGDNGTCLCNNGFIRLEDGCVQGKRNIFT